MYKLCCVLVLVTLATSGYCSPFEDCGSSGGEVTSVEVTNCSDDQDTCVLKKGNDVGVTIKFESKEATKTLKAVVHGVISGVPIPFPIPQPDACKSGVSCPVQSGQQYTYNNKFEVRRSYPSVSVTVRYELKDENSGDVVCVEIPAKLES